MLVREEVCFSSAHTKEVGEALFKVVDPFGNNNGWLRPVRRSPVAGDVDFWVVVVFVIVSSSGKVEAEVDGACKLVNGLGFDLIPAISKSWSRNEFQTEAKKGA